MTNFLAHLVQRTLEPTAGVQPRRSSPFEPTRFELPPPAIGPNEAEHAAPRFDGAREFPETESREAVGENSTIDVNARVTEAEHNPVPSANTAPSSRPGDVGMLIQSLGDERAVGGGDLFQQRRPNGMAGVMERAPNDAMPGLDSTLKVAAVWPRAAISPRQTEGTVTLDAQVVGVSDSVLRSDSRRQQSGAAQAQPHSQEPEHRRTITSARVWAEDSSNAPQLKASLKASPSIPATGISPLPQLEHRMSRLAEGDSHAPSGELAPTVHVTIGTIEVRALTAPTLGAQPSKRAAPAKPSMSLTDYLERRSGGRR